ncbi:YWFCY domain-containing protein [Puia dinghuensis]|uniref:Conjugal transfer protein TraG n=1 Tax=Puia dinghuensis TaxID=1792502 RepID=A0A8J2XTR9_9BACT|nr:YWFCY domain-containing protein [Puia dinghuensis]GGB01480.1 conjugal transfer protein TraG [Puia dinghuensis]
MSKPTGQDENALHRILDTIRIAGILLLLLHFFCHNCPSCREAGPGDPIIQRLVDTIANLPLIAGFLAGKSLALLLLGISLLGADGKKSPDYTPRCGLTICIGGIFLYFVSGILAGTGLPYILLCGFGYLLVLYGGNYLSRVIWHRSDPDIFNRLHESFPQEQRLITNPRSVNLPAHFQYNGATLESWLNFVVPARGTLILGTPGSGKTAYVLQHFIRQMIQKGYAMVLHDFKYDDLSRLTYNYFLRFKSRYPKGVDFYNIQFDDLNRSHRCNLLHPATLTDITDAEESARALLLGLNMEWLGKQGEFFVESAISFVKALIWYLRLYKDGIYCTWPHVIELAQTPLKKLFTILRAEPQLQAHIGPFVDALVESANEQLAGQIASATISLSKLSSPKLYYILTGNDFTLDLNNPQSPKILTLGNNPQKAATNGPVISAYLNAINRLANKKGGHPLAVILEEFSTIAVHTIDKTIATGRSNDIAVTLCLQNSNQLKHAYGDKLADVILHTCGNIISGQVTGDTARLLADRFGRTMQHRESLTSTYADLQITQSHQLEPVIPESRIANLSPGEFVGMVADTPEQPIPLKTFCCRIDADFPALNAEEATYQPLPNIREVTPEILDANFRQVRAEIDVLVQSEMVRISSSPELHHLVIQI